MFNGHYLGERSAGVKVGWKGCVGGPAVIAKSYNTGAPGHFPGGISD